MEIKGEVILKKVNLGSKSEHEAVCLLTSEGASIRLRRPGGNPFNDDKLSEWVGKNVTIKGDFFKPVLEQSSRVGIFMCSEIKEL